MAVPETEHVETKINEAPIAEIDPHVQKTEFGLEWSDDYFYMRNREDPRVIPYLEAENIFADQKYAHLEDLREEVYQDILGRIVEDDTTVPVRKGKHEYYSRTETGKPYKIYCRKSLEKKAEEEIILDCNKYAEGLEFFQIGFFSTSPDLTCVAYGIDIKGDERYTLHIKNLETKEDFGPVIENVSKVRFDNLGNIYYTKPNEAWHCDNLYRTNYMEAAENSADEILIMHEKDQQFDLSLQCSSDRSIIFIKSESNITTELYYVLANEIVEPKLIFKRKQERELSIDRNGDYFYIMGNENAINFEFFRVHMDDPENTKEILISHSEDVTLEDFEMFENFIAIEERSGGFARVRILNPHNLSFYYVDFDLPACTLQTWGSNMEPHFHNDVVRVCLDTPICPTAYYDFNMATEEKTLAKQKPINNHNPEDYTMEYIFARGYDGTQIPMTLVYLKTLEVNSDTPVVMEGYGAYGFANDFVYWNKVYTFVNKGAIFCQAHIRGGGEFGRKWKNDGKLFKKQNTFLDFISCAEHLIFKNYTNPEKLIIWGTSAGGLLIGSTINMRPELFKGAMLSVPFVDVLNSMADASLPLTTGEWDEWGNPQKEEYFEYINRYSPYNNIWEQKYPQIFIQSSINDTRVLFHEPAKYCAKLRTVGANVTMKMNLVGGHGGKSGRYGKIREASWGFAWALELLGLTKAVLKGKL